MNSMPSTVAVVFGGTSPEHDVSILTGLQAVHALAKMSSVSAVHALYWATSGAWFEVPNDIEATAFASGVPSSAKPIEFALGSDGGFGRRGRLGKFERLQFEAAVNCCHGGAGEDGALQGAFDLAGVSYSGPSALGAALGLDKLTTCALLSHAGLPVLPRILFEESSSDPDFGGPYILKPRTGGSSIGIDVVNDAITARARLHANVHLRHGAVLEPYRPDLFDLNVAVRTWPELQLSAIERPIRKGTSSGILDYADKYVGSEGMASAPREIPADITEELAEKIRSYATTAASLFGVRGVARIDFLSDGNELYVNEINTIPGSLSRHLFVKPVVTFEELLTGLLTEAVARPPVQYSSAGADGTVLRGAASISSKLG